MEAMWILVRCKNYSIDSTAILTLLTFANVIDMEEHVTEIFSNNIVGTLVIEKNSVKFYAHFNDDSKSIVSFPSVFSVRA